MILNSDCKTSQIQCAPQWTSWFLRSMDKLRIRTFDFWNCCNLICRLRNSMHVWNSITLRSKDISQEPTISSIMITCLPFTRIRKNWTCLTNTITNTKLQQLLTTRVRQIYIPTIVTDQLHSRRHGLPQELQTLIVWMIRVPVSQSIETIKNQSSWS